MLRISDTISIEDWELTESFIRSSGPGGQNVNKVSSAVELRFEAERSPNLPEPVKSRLRRIAGRRWTKDGALVLLTPNALGVDSRAAITTITDRSFEEIRRAPADTAAYVDAVTVEFGPVYVVQTDESIGGFGTRCVYYAKLEALDIDTELGTLLFRYDSNPVCNSRDLIPPED